MRRLALLPAALLFACPEPDPSGSTGTDAGTSSGTTSATSAASTTSSTSNTTGPEPTTSTTAASISAGSVDPATTSGGPPPGLDCSGIPTGTVGVPYLATLEANGEGTVFEWQIVTLNPPAWLTLQAQADSRFADLTGTPDAAGTFMFTVEVFNNVSEEPGFAACTLVIAAAAAP